MNLAENNGGRFLSQALVPETGEIPDLPTIQQFLAEQKRANKPQVLPPNVAMQALIPLLTGSDLSKSYLTYANVVLKHGGLNLIPKLMDHARRYAGDALTRRPGEALNPVWIMKTLEQIQNIFPILCTSFPDEKLDELVSDQRFKSFREEMGEQKKILRKKYPNGEIRNIESILIMFGKRTQLSIGTPNSRELISEAHEFYVRFAEQIFPPEPTSEDPQEVQDAYRNSLGCQMKPEEEKALCRLGQQLLKQRRHLESSAQEVGGQETPEAQRLRFFAGDLNALQVLANTIRALTEEEGTSIVMRLRAEFKDEFESLVAIYPDQIVYLRQRFGNTMPNPGNLYRWVDQPGAPVLQQSEMYDSRPGASYEK